MLHVPRWVALGLVILVSAPRAVRAQDSPISLAKASENPIGTVINFPLDNFFGFVHDTARGTLYGLSVRGLVPMPVGNDGDRLVARFAVPVSELSFSDSASAALGDTRLELLYAGGASGPENGYAFGLGPAFSFPTATKSAFGSGRWEAGLSFTQVVVKARWVVGAGLSQLWSFAGQSSRRATAPFIGEPFVYYNMADGWTLLSAPEISADWYVAWSEGWSLPLGGGIAKTFQHGREGTTVSLTAYGNAVRPIGAPTWMIHAQLSLLYPLAYP